MKKLPLSIAVVALSAIFAVPSVVAETYSWSQLKEADNRPHADYREGSPVLFCYAYKSKAECQVATSPPPNMDCVSTHTTAVPGQWYNLGDVTGIDAIEGDGNKTCHGRVVPAGQWWGANLNYKRQ